VDAAEQEPDDRDASTALLAAAPAGMLWPAIGGGRVMDIGADRRGKRERTADALAIPFQQFFATAAVPCPYVPGRAERKLIVELAGPAAPEFYDELSRAGFRRSHRFSYRPACQSCAACVPVRIAVSRFADTRSTRRVRNLNAGIRAGAPDGGTGDAVAGRLLAPRATVEQFELFALYQRSRHCDSEMAAMSYADYRGMVEDSAVRTAIVEFRASTGALVAVSLIDRLDDGISAVYSFYDPTHRRRSLGTWCILWLIEECRGAGLDYVYLGYWIAESPKMAYKARFPALERLARGRWIPFAND
jgi:arginyl-tRNA--protein-N-Asp/Glu arginylyltransferase